MDFITSWVQGIIIAVIIGSIIEMLLPNGNSKKYIKVVIGVYIVFSIVSPIISKFTGSEGGLRYLLRKHSGEDGDLLEVVFWHGELCSDATPEEEKMIRHFPFSEDGILQAQEWLNQQL